MKTHSFNVIPNLPENLKKLADISMNMWFTWNWEAIMMMVGMDEGLWHKSHRNPKWVLGSLPPERLDELSRDPEFLKRLESVWGHYQDYLKRPTWFEKYRSPQEEGFTAAYFSMEYGIGEGLPIYSGGLGMLSGDHLKTASDLGLPVIGVGLLYQKGYIQQVLNRDFWQVERYPENDWYNMPVQIVNDGSDKPLRVEVPLGDEIIKAGVWKVPVGRTSLYLLDTNIPDNPPHYRDITEQLYGGDRETRIRQEIVLGVGGVKALSAMGINPTVYHINEGHSAFLLFERIRMLMSENKFSFSQAREAVWASSVFTTHTPVIAGNEHFDPGLVKRYMEPYSRQFGISWDEFLKMGKEDDNSPSFCMTVVALRLAAFLNSVSLLHQKTSRSMWQKVWPSLPEHEIPIQNVTNGVHTCSWVSHEYHELYRKYITQAGQSCDADMADAAMWAKVENIPDEELWGAHIIRKNKLFNLVRDRLKRQLTRQGADPTVVGDVNALFDPGLLTIGFARRFASYKRANLIFRDLERLEEIVNNSKMPVQFIFAGKAHQADTVGKEIVKSVARLMTDKRFRGRVVFVEDYNMNVARYLVQGVDVWLNNPIRPMEASGTSGMKAAVNGVLNLSVLDGWWCEGYSPETGWAVGGAEQYKDDEERDYVESEAVYNLIQKVIAPLYYRKDDKGISRDWMRMMKSSIKKLAPVFSTHRMLREYYDRFYVPANRACRKLAFNGGAREVAGWRSKIEMNWPMVKVAVESFKPDMEIRAGNKVPVRAKAWLGELTPDEVEVQIYTGKIDASGSFMNGMPVTMHSEGRDGDAYVFAADILCGKSGRHNFAVRVLPKHGDLPHSFMPLFIKWNE